MSIECIDAVWLEKRGEVSVEGLAELSGLSEEELRELVNCGALVPTNPDAVEWTFGAHYLMIVQTAGRLRRDFDLDPPALALAVTLIRRVKDLEAELRQLRVLIPHRSS